MGVEVVECSVNWGVEVVYVYILDFVEMGVRCGWGGCGSDIVGLDVGVDLGVCYVMGF